MENVTELMAISFAENERYKNNENRCNPTPVVSDLFKYYGFGNYGIYTIVNIPREFVYIGKSIDLPHRILQHFRCMCNKSKRDNRNLIDDMYKYQIEDFQFYILEHFTIDQISTILPHGRFNINYENGSKIFIQELESYYIYQASFLKSIRLYNTVIKIYPEFEIWNKVSKDLKQMNRLNVDDHLNDLIKEINWKKYEEAKFIKDWNIGKWRENVGYD